MRTIQIVLEEELLRAADRAAREVKVNRSALVRQALREYLNKLQLRQQERRDREGYQRYPDTPGELAVWERVAAWPEK
jgi:metal-responsive CopG/Arc/MetJ family transcriptional regulator